MPVHWFNPETSELATAVTAAGEAGLISIDDRFGSEWMPNGSGFWVWGDGIGRKF